MNDNGNQANHAVVANAISWLLCPFFERDKVRRVKPSALPFHWVPLLTGAAGRGIWLSSPFSPELEERTTLQDGPRTDKDWGGKVSRPEAIFCHLPLFPVFCFTASSCFRWSLAPPCLRHFSDSCPFTFPFTAHESRKWAKLGLNSCLLLRPFLFLLLFPSLNVHESAALPESNSFYISCDTSCAHLFSFRASLFTSWPGWCSFLFLPT